MSDDCIIIYLHELLNLFYGQPLLIIATIEHHYDAHLECANNAVIRALRELGIDCCTSKTEGILCITTKYFSFNSHYFTTTSE